MRDHGLQVADFIVPVRHDVAIRHPRPRKVEGHQSVIQFDDVRDEFENLHARPVGRMQVNYAVLARAPPLKHRHLQLQLVLIDQVQILPRVVHLACREIGTSNPHERLPKS